MGADPDLNRIEAAELGLACGLQPCCIMRLDPVPEEAGRHRNEEAAVGQFLGLHPGEPAGEKVISEFPL